MSQTFTFTWNPDRDGEEIKAHGRTADRLQGWCETMVLSRDPSAGVTSEEWASASIDLNDFCDDLEHYVEGLRHRVCRGYTPALRDAMSMAALEVFEAAPEPMSEEQIAELSHLRSHKPVDTLSTEQMEHVERARREALDQVRAVHGAVRAV